MCCFVPEASVIGPTRSLRRCLSRLVVPFVKERLNDVLHRNHVGGVSLH